MHWRMAQNLLALSIVAAGTTAYSVSRAATAGGCSMKDPRFVVCVNHGDDGNLTRGDFYINRPPDSSIYTYREVLVLNGREMRGPKTGRIDHRGRFCCLYKNLQTLPPRAKRVKNRVYVYTRAGVHHMREDSPEITVRN